MTGKLPVLCRQLNVEQSCFRSNNKELGENITLGFFYECHKISINPELHNNKVIIPWKEMEMRTPDLSGNRFKRRSNLDHLLMAEGTGAEWETRRCWHQQWVFLFNRLLFMFCRISFNVAVRLKLRKYSPMKGIKHWRSVGEQHLRFFAFSIVALWNGCGTDRHSVSLQHTKLFFKTLNANPFGEEPVIPEHVFLIMSLPRFLPAVHKCVWGWT